MIFGIGTDIVRIKRMADSLQRHGDKFAERILSAEEMAVFQKSENRAHYLAKRFAAKEATSKAMGTGFRNGLSLRHISVSNDDKGKPVLRFSEQAAQFMQEHNIVESHVSLADENEYAVAFVTLVKK
ncbi:MAG: holo-ACP synthase [Thioalkalispiraceae bacterium]|jgi:holo-[acyl-carrier protein] synthase